MADTGIARIAAVSTRGMTDVFPSANSGGTTEANFTLVDISGTKRWTLSSADTVVQNDHMKAVEATNGAFTLAFAPAAIY